MGKYTLIITEKPDAARRIALALDVSQKARRMEDDGVPYYVAMRDKEIVIVPALGHLYTVSTGAKGRGTYPVFDFEWVPRFQAERGAAHVRKWLQVISKLSRNADSFIDACDFDMEGSVIGYCILKYACNDKEKMSRRMKYSTLTKEELEKSYAESLPHLDFALIEAGRARHEIDWLYGINLSRALSFAAKNWSGKYSTLSTGRVQGPLLKFLVSREKSIRSFVPTPYWQIKAQVEINGQTCMAEFGKRRIETKAEAEAVSNACKGSGQIEKVEVLQFQQSAPVPFDLGTLQVEAYTSFRYDPKKTLGIAQRLYLGALISYPRTSSQKLPPAINYRSILKNLSGVREYRRLAADLLGKPVLKPHEGGKDDSAHPAIYPTGNLPEHLLNKSERNIWDLVVRRFMAVFGEPAVRQSLKANIKVDGYLFYVNGKRTLEQGWQRFYERYVRAEETLLPLVKEGQVVDFKKVIVESRFTEPPPRYNPCSLLQKMEEVEIGTKATRADIIQTLYERKYVRNERMTVTDLGFEVLEILKSYCEKIVSIEMTKELENRIDGICQNREKREDVLVGAIEILGPVLTEIRQKEGEIGERLSNAVERTRLEESIIGPCPVCKTGKLVTIHSKKTGKRFVGCTNYFRGLCRASFALPQKGTIKVRGRNCRGCGWPTVEVRTGGKRTWVLCFNPDCTLKEGKRERGIATSDMQQPHHQEV
ncbi:MAG TPA: DNA topoisomerase I [candidate division Zixibacteria bacterium]|nr:DNA topoisomerase I [candidate division Zixibacteria bacterium]